MSQLLLELFSEEIPSRMQARASEDLRKLVVDGLKAQGLDSGTAHAFATPRRLALVVDGVPEHSPGVSEERKGPRVGAPEKAIEGFLKGAGLASLADATVVKDEKKGDFYVARIEKPGRPAREIIEEVVASVVAKFPWPKSQRWGTGSLTWVRPLHSIVCMLDGHVVPLVVGDMVAGRETRGHRFHGNTPFTVDSFEDYGRKLKSHKVLLPASERAAWIAEQAQAIAKGAKLELVEDEGLLAENAGLTEWPTVLMGTFDEAFLSVPAECLTTSMKNHQKCFSLRNPKTGKLANRFLCVSNLIAKDGGAQIVAGNEKVIRARLSDAKFFWDQDLKRPLDEMASQLRGITFHEKLGSQWDRVERIAELAFQLAGACDAVPEDARRAAQLAKADLVSGMVGEFPELQGLMGRHYAETAGTKPEIARAIELHYKPKGPSDTVPKEEEGDAVACAVALADKLDTLVGFWAIGEKPTGSGDPYQLRRAALGVIRILLENDFRLPLVEKIRSSLFRLISKQEIEWRETIKLLFDREETDQSDFQDFANGGPWVWLTRQLQPADVRRIGDLFNRRMNDKSWSDDDSQFMIEQENKLLEMFLTLERYRTFTSLRSDRPPLGESETLYQDQRLDLEFEAATQHMNALSLPLLDDLLTFLADRLKVHLREKGARHDLIDAVFSLGGQDDLALIVKRVEALGEFLKTDDGANLLAGVKRAANILSIEEKKDKRSHAGTYDLKLLSAKEELALAAAIETVKQDTVAAINVENFAGAMRALAELRAPVDQFFEKVTVNDADPKIRANRLAMLSEIRAATLNVADFSRIAG